MVIFSMIMLILISTFVVKLVYDVQIAKKEKRSGTVYAEDFFSDNLN